MTQITVLNKANVPTGPFTREQVTQKLASGEIALEDLAFVEGLSQWTPLRQVLAQVDAVTPPALPPLRMPAPAVIAPAAAVPAYSYAATMEPPPHLIYGGFWLRLVAYFIDGLIIGIPVGVVFGILGAVMGGFAALTGNLNNPDHSDPANMVVAGGFAIFELIIFIVSIAGCWLYFALLESSAQQSTFGKRVMGLRVTNMAGQRISFAHASGRFFGKMVTGLIPLGIGYIMAAFTARKQALHDLIAGTLVVRG